MLNKIMQESIQSAAAPIALVVQPTPLPEGKMSTARSSLLYVLSITGGEQKLRQIKDFILKDLFLNRIIVDRVGARNIKNRMMKARAGEFWWAAEAFIWKICQVIRKYFKVTDNKTYTANGGDNAPCVKEKPSCSFCKTTSWWKAPTKPKKIVELKEIEEDIEITFKNIFEAGYEGLGIYMHQIILTDSDYEVDYSVPGAWIDDPIEDINVHAGDNISITDKTIGIGWLQGIGRTWGHIRNFVPFAKQSERNNDGVNQDIPEVSTAAISEETIIKTTSIPEKYKPITNKSNKVSLVEYDISEQRINFEGGMRGVVIHADELLIPEIDTPCCKLKRRGAIRDKMRRWLKKWLFGRHTVFWGYSSCYLL